MIVVATWDGIGSVYLAVNESYARPEYYWSTVREFAKQYKDGSDPLKKVRSARLRKQVTDIRADK